MDHFVALILCDGCLLSPCHPTSRPSQDFCIPGSTKQQILFCGLYRNRSESSLSSSICRSLFHHCDHLCFPIFIRIFCPIIQQSEVETLRNLPPYFYFQLSEHLDHNVVICTGCSLPERHVISSILGRASSTSLGSSLFNLLAAFHQWHL